jgi:16S rRNA (cytosine967-C5)-methyltransferase
MKGRSLLHGMPVRAVAARLLARLMNGSGSLADGLPEADTILQDSRDRALLRLTLYETIRSFYFRQAVLRLLLQRPLATAAREIEALILLGLTQLELGIDNDYAVVDASVEATRVLGHPQLTSLVNALLRRALRESNTLRQRVTPDDEIETGHPQWLVDRLRADWGGKAEQVFSANNEQAPVWLRVHSRRATRAQAMERLLGAGFECVAHPTLPDAIRLAQSGDVSVLPGWQDGWFSVQDAAAQNAVELLNLAPGLNVLDACCAPGGKLAHIAEREPELGVLIGLDRDGKRLEQTRSAMLRLGLRPTLKQADASRVPDWWKGDPFDRILLDAPCSGTGVIRRHPDIRLLRRNSDIPDLIRTQTSLLEALWPLLAARGRLVYSTCSVLKDENERQIAGFISRHPDARMVPGEPCWFDCVGLHGNQNLPGAGAADGFFYAVIERHN